MTGKDHATADTLVKHWPLITGGYAGVGLETTRVLAEAGATVIVPARSLDKARAALQGLPGVEIGAVALDLADPASIDASLSRLSCSFRYARAVSTRPLALVTTLPDWCSVASA